MGDRRRRLVAWAARRRPRFGVPSPAGADPWAWLEPYPVAPGAGAQRSLSIAFVAALQRLPPDQRAALVLSDVLEFPLTEVADILDCDVTEAGHLLLRARAAIGVPAQACADVGREAEVVALFTGAFERGDIAAIAALLAQDAWLRMRPLPIAYRGRAAARHFLSVVAFPGGLPGYRLVGTRSRANGQPAFGCYLRDPAAAVDHACGLVMLTIDDDGRIAAIDRFTDNSMLPRFGLPRTLPATTELRGIQCRHVLQFRVAVTGPRN
ncbi:MAG: sigma factor-like helix-turn-helix DNA-binding protein [Trebonia sp.]